MMKKKKKGIYKITSPIGRVYIGQSVNIEKRFKIHQGVYGDNNTKLKRSFNKYGVENHKFEILEYCPINKLDEREIFWGVYYNTLNEGLNCKLGEQNPIFSEFTKKKISKNKKGHPCYKDPQRGIKISNKLKGRKKTWVKGKEKIGKKQENSFREKVSKMKSKPILQYDKNNKFLKEYSSIKQASLKTQIHRENISCVLRGITNHAGGYIWKYKI